MSVEAAPPAQPPTTLSDRQILEFERPIIDLEKKISELRHLLRPRTVDFSAEIRKLEQKARKLQKEVFADLSAQQKVQLARHPARPYMNDYISLLMDDFVELHGDRSFHDDPAIVGGMAQVRRVGSPRARPPEGPQHEGQHAPELRDGAPRGLPQGEPRLMRMASGGFAGPIICFIDTPGAYPGLGAEERGQSRGTDREGALQVMASLECPMISAS